MDKRASIFDILTSFSKLKVFPQILIVIVFMLTFLSVEGLMSIQNINKMQTRNEELFRNGVRGMNSIFDYKLKIERLKNTYQQAIMIRRQEPVYFPISAADFEIDSFHSEDNQIKKIAENLDRIRKIIAQPASNNNWRKIEKIIAANSLYLQNVDLKLQAQINSTNELGIEFSKKAKLITTILLITSFSLSVLLALLTTKSISQPLNVIVGAARDLAKGDLSRNIHATGCFEAVYVVNSLQQAFDSLRQLVFGIREHSELLLNAGKELNLAATDTGKSTAEVSRTMEELSRATMEETNVIVKAVDNIQDFSRLVQRVSYDTAKIAQSSDLISRTTKTGQQVVTEAAASINSLYLSTQNATRIIGELNIKTNEVTKITHMIEEIAEQTSLLALNASIEAARAGANGRGFSVVAMETGKLAAQSKQAAKTITNMLVEIQLGSEQAVQVIETGMKKATSSKEFTTKVKTAFDEITVQLEDIVNKIQHVAGASRQMAEKNKDVSAAMDNISAISEETMASTEEVTAATQQQNASVEEVGALAENVFAIANRLKESVVVFRV
jgi:methyl-accepting chemotaxis protein